MAEYIKEPLRIVVLALLAWLLAGGIEWVVGLFGLPLDAMAQLTILLLLILRGLDKYLHESSKVKPISKQRSGLLGVKGLTGF